MSKLWGGMILAGVIYGAFHGTLPEITEGILSSSKEAVLLCMGLLGITAFWSGLMKIAEKAGMIRQMTRRIHPLLHFLFPRVPEDHPALKYIGLNLICNFFGLGAAATPPGLLAMEELQVLDDERRRNGSGLPKGTAGKEMCTFLILNISSLQLLPVNILAYRSQYGSVHPTAVVGPAILATAVSTITAVIFCKIMDR